jgi:hypothetical protein
VSTDSDWAINCFLFAAAGTISQAMHNAARDLRAAIIVANLDPLRAVPVLRVPGTGVSRS